MIRWLAGFIGLWVTLVLPNEGEPHSIFISKSGETTASISVSTSTEGLITVTGSGTFATYNWARG